jgi:IS5 family transposase
MAAIQSRTSLQKKETSVYRKKNYDEMKALEVSYISWRGNKLDAQSRVLLEKV